MSASKQDTSPRRQHFVGRFSVSLFILLGMCSAALPGVAAYSSAAPAPMTTVHSAGVDDILKMVDAKVDSSVVKEFIHNSPVAYNPTAQEIISLKQKGVSDEVVAAMLARGGELRNQMRAAVRAVPEPSAAPGAGAYGTPL